MDDLKESSQATDRARKREQFESDFTWLMCDPRGRRLMFRLLSEMGIYKCTFDAGVKETALEMAFREGQKNLGYKLMRDINTLCPDAYFEMLKESNNG